MFISALCCWLVDPCVLALALVPALLVLAVPPLSIPDGMADAIGLGCPLTLPECIVGASQGLKARPSGAVRDAEIASPCQARLNRDPRNDAQRRTQ